MGGWVILPRILDKCRATIAGTNGAYDFDCPTDQQFFDFAGISPQELKEQVATGKSDGEILVWLRAYSRTKPNPAQIASWSAYQEKRAPMDLESREFYQEEHQRIAPQRDDLATWFDYLDLDDYVSFGGRA